MDISDKLGSFLVDDINEDVIDEKMYGFGTNGIIEMFGDDVTISKNGKSVQITKKELISILLKLGLTKKRK